MLPWCIEFKRNILQLKRVLNGLVISLRFCSVIWGAYNFCKNWKESLLWRPYQCLLLHLALEDRWNYIKVKILRNIIPLPTFNIVSKKHQLIRYSWKLLYWTQLNNINDVNTNNKVFLNWSQFMCENISTFIA